MKNKISGVIMASGSSKRMGQNKLLLPFLDTTIIEYMIDICKKSNLLAVVVVTNQPEIIHICKKMGVFSIYNEYAYLGQSQSIKLGVDFFYDCEALMFLTADIPSLTEVDINKLCANYCGEILVPTYRGKKQNPVIFPKYYFDKLRNLSGDFGGKEVYIHEKIHMMEMDRPVSDIDTIQDYHKFKEAMND